MTSFWWLILFSVNEFFVFRLESVKCKKYTNTNGKDSKYTHAINITMVWSYSMERGLTAWKEVEGVGLPVEEGVEGVEEGVEGVELPIRGGVGYW